MSASRNLIPSYEKDISANAASQASSTFSARLKASADQKGWKQADLVRESRVPSGRVSEYWKGPKQPSAEYLFALARALSVSPEWLALGKGPVHPYGLTDVTEADWIEIPEHDLGELTSAGRGESLGEIPFRRDWLNRSFRRDKGLWLARLLSDYAPADLAEGDEVILRDIGEDDLQERQLILWRVHGRLAIGRFSATIRPTEPNGEYWVPPVLIGDQEEDMTPVARILGRPLAPIR